MIKAKHKRMKLLKNHEEHGRHKPELVASAYNEKIFYATLKSRSFSGN
jgi:hypothetical protein